ncbi:Ankyrin repeat family protein [Melia azedarach]|uniref:Ankyrin repeat family protein n=1 Tax=Melia azedarach TaxID=155640 RepID=A0ACC1Y182_MELAZ|nr:Ankyrin repeat family protein [Melia azedarach]
MESMLYEAALKGSVPTLLELLQQDPLILDKVTMNSISEIPLHVASLLGHVDFVKQILCQKPELANELDSQQYSALHIASQKGYVEIVRALLQVNPDMCFARDVDGRNPLHLAAMKGRIDCLGELIKSRPLAASATTIWGETISHVCVKYNQLEALKFLLENIDDPEILKAKDDYGMTILHLAVAEKQIEIIKVLTTSTKVKVNDLNANGLTALDILAQSKRDVKYWETGELLRRAGAISAKDIQLSANELGISKTNSLTSNENNQKQQGKGLENIHEKEDDWLEKKRNALMVVASLIATMAFQAGVNPPHSPWQDTFQNTKRRYGCFLFFNTAGFLASLSIILLLISGLPLKRRLFMWILMVIMWVAITAMAMTYMVSIDFLLDPVVILPSGPYILTYIWLSIGGILFLGHMIRLIVKMIKYFRKLTRRPWYTQAQDSDEPPIASIV